MTPDRSLAQRYRDYIAALNLDDASMRDEAFGLQPYIQDGVIHNGRVMTRNEYAHLIIDARLAINGMKFFIHLLTVDEAREQVAARLCLRGTLASPFLDIVPPPEGRDVEFYEHVFYQWRQGKIIEVWSVIDEAGLKQEFTPDKSDVAARNQGTAVQ